MLVVEEIVVSHQPFWCGTLYYYSIGTYIRKTITIYHLRYDIVIISSQNDLGLVYPITKDFECVRRF